MAYPCSLPTIVKKYFVGGFIPHPCRFLQMLAHPLKRCFLVRKNVLCVQIIYHSHFIKFAARNVFHRMFFYSGTPVGETGHAKPFRGNSSNFSWIIITDNCIHLDLENKVLIITYYWPPSGGSGVQRWLKFVKYLPQFGWTPYVFTPEKPAFGVRDETLLADVPREAEIIHFPIREPYELFLKLSKALGAGRKSNTPTHLVGDAGTRKRTWFERFSIWVRGNLFIPDPRVFWVKPSARFLKHFIRQNHIRHIITTGPPHSVHLIGYRLKKELPEINWVADFRDPWSQWGLLDTLQTGKLARKIHQRLEQKVLTTADQLVSITPFFVKAFSTLAGRKVTLITNGFDDSDFQNFTYRRTHQYIIRHIGIVNEKCDPRVFMMALKAVAEENVEFRSLVRMEFLGEVHPQFRAFVEQDATLKAITHFIGYVSHQEVLACYAETSLLLLNLTGYKNAEGYLPGKLFEYLATGLPIIGLGPLHGDAAHVMAETRAGVMIADGDMPSARKALRSYFKVWKITPSQPVRMPGANQYTRYELTRFLTTLLHAADRGTDV